MRERIEDYISFEQINYKVKKLVTSLVIDLDEMNLLRGREQQVEYFVDHVVRQLVLRLMDAHYEREVMEHEVSWPDGAWQHFKDKRPRLTRIFFRPVRYCKVKFTVLDVLKDVQVRGPRHALAVTKDIGFILGWPP